MTRKTLAAAVAVACALPLVSGAAHAKPLVVRTPILVQPQPQPGPGPCIQCGSRIKVGNSIDPVINPTMTLPTGTLSR
jgi:hypothetical protein